MWRATFRQTTTATGIVLALATKLVAAQGLVVDPVTVCFEGTGNPELDVFYCNQAIDGETQTGLGLATLYAFRGRAHAGIARYDRALADFDFALTLNPRSAMAYNNRGLVRHAKGDYKAALGDFDQAILLFPRYQDAYRNRGTARYFLADFAAAAADYTAAIDIFPDDPPGYVLRGLAYYFSGRPARAVADLETASTMRYPYPYLAIWLYLARERSRGDGRAALEAWSKELEDGAWPNALVDFYLNRLSEAAVIAAAQALPPAGRTMRLMQAYYFLGERARLSGQEKVARRLFEAALASDAQRSIEWASANAALRLVKP